MVLYSFCGALSEYDVTNLGGNEIWNVLEGNDHAMIVLNCKFNEQLSHILVSFKSRKGKRHYKVNF